MSLATLGAPAPPEAPDTYALEDTLTENYTTTAGTTGAAISLETKIAWPTVDDTTVPRFCVINIGMGGWLTTSVASVDTQADWITGMGGIHMGIETRVRGDNPLSTGDSASHNLLRRGIRAPIFDLDTALKYILANYLEGNGGTMPYIEPRWIFAMGISAGGVTCHLHSQVYPSRRFAGLITMVAGYGMDSIGTDPDDATDIIRDQLKFNYKYHSIPTCSFLGGADTTLGADRVTEFRTHLNTRPDNIVHYDADGTHGAGWGSFDTTALTDADTEQEAIYNFIARRCAAVQPTYIARTNYRAWGRNWLNLQSRFW